MFRGNGIGKVTQRALLGCLLITGLNVQVYSVTPVNLKGTVTDSITGNTIASAVVKLVAAKLSDTTDSKGQFSIQSTSVLTRFSPTVSNDIRITSYGFAFQSSIQQQVSISIFNTSGIKVFNSSRAAVTGNNFIARPQLASGAYIFVLNMANGSFSRKFISTTAGNFDMAGQVSVNIANELIAEAAKSGFTDTLIITASAFSPKKIALSSAVDTNMAIKLTASGPVINVDTTWLRKRLSELSGALPSPIDNKPINDRWTKENRKRAYDLLKRYYQECGYKVTDHNYTSPEAGINLIAEKEGINKDKFLVVGAHYDGVSGVQAADDNGSGTIGVLGVAAMLASMPPLKYGIRFLAFDNEEKGFHGSLAYVEKIKKDNEKSKLIGAICADGMTWDSNNDGHVCLADAGGGGAQGNKVLTDALLAVISKNNLPLVLINNNRSGFGTDMGSFWQSGMVAINIGNSQGGTNQLTGAKTASDDPPCYHQTCDKVDKVNFAYMLKLTKLMALAAEKLASGN
jgi:hypothetical protein